MRLKVIGEVAAGRPFDRAVGPGEAVRIFTGGVVPAGRRRDRDPGGHDARRRRCRDRARRRPRAGIASAGARLRRRRSLLLKRGHRLSARDLALAAAMNHAAAAGASPPRVAILATGDELVPPGDAARPRPDRLFQRLCADGARARTKAQTSSTSASPATGSTRPIAAVRRARALERRHAGHDRRRFGRRI